MTDEELHRTVTPGGSATDLYEVGCQTCPDLIWSKVEVWRAEYAHFAPGNGPAGKGHRPAQTGDGSIAK